MLTPAQKLTLKAYIAGQNDLNVQPDTNDGNEIIAAALNAPSSPAFTVWRSSVTQDEIMGNGMDWTRVDNLSVGKARIWEWMFRNAENAIQPAKATIRAGIDATWVGTAADLAVRSQVYVHCKRVATRGEQAFASGTGSDASPGVLAFEGTLTYVDVEEARRING